MGSFIQQAFANIFTVIYTGSSTVPTHFFSLSYVVKLLENSYENTKAENVL